MTDSVDPRDAREKLTRGEAVLVDVREPDAFAKAHPAGAINIPIGELEARLGELPDDVEVVTSCGGGTRGPKAAAQLRALGVDARPLTGGLRGWTGAELPVDGAT